MCSEHFKSEDYLCGGEDPQAARRMLKNTAVPSVFPWPSPNVNKERTTANSQRAAALVLESDSSFSDEDSEPSLNELYELDAETIDCESVEYLKAKVADLSQQLVETQAKLEKSLFQLANIKEDDGLVSFILASQTMIHF